ncbi:MAG: acyltransferase [Lachnospiraceae bacterium]|nr:acyltransferase [Lachnospiraceae bacterium]
MKKSKRIHYLSYIRALACIAVVVLHAALFAWKSFQPEDERSYLTLMVRSACTWAVPCFLMVTGALLLDPGHKVTIRKTLGKYLKKIVIVTAVFIFLYQLFDFCFLKGSLSVMGYLRALYTNDSWSNTFYLYALIAIYLCLPIYRKMAEDDQVVVYFLVLEIIFLSILPVIQEATGLKAAFTIYVTSIYPFYLVLGYVLKEDIIHIPRPVGALLFLVGTGLLIGMTYLSYPVHGEGNKLVRSFLQNYDSLLIILQSAGFFSMLKNDHEDGRGNLVLLAIDKCTLGIYLVQMFGFKYLYGVMKMNPYDAGDMWWLTLLGIAVGVFAGSYVLVFIWNLIKKLVTGRNKQRKRRK